MRSALEQNGNAAGVFIYISVKNVDEFYQGLLASGFNPVSEPVDSPASNREFLLLDPDGYQLVFFKRR